MSNRVLSFEKEYSKKKKNKNRKSTFHCEFRISVWEGHLNNSSLDCWPEGSTSQIHGLADAESDHWWSSLQQDTRKNMLRKMEIWIKESESQIITFDVKESKGRLPIQCSPGYSKGTGVLWDSLVFQGMK